MIFFSILPIIIPLVFIIVDCSAQGQHNLTNEISSIYFDIVEFQKSLNDDNSSSENLLKIVKDLSSTLILIISQLESSKSFESASIKKLQNLQTEMEELRKDVNETECSLSIRIIDIENDISKLKYEPEITTETQTASTFDIRRKRLLNISFLTPTLSYRRARMYCRREGGMPFVPKTKAELYYVAQQVTAGNEYGWLPLSDIMDEGVGEWDDGTSYAEGLRLEFGDTDSLNGNSDEKDCVDVNKEGTADWYECSKERKMLCIAND